MDKTDLKILNLLLEKPGIKYRQIAEELGSTVGTIHNRIKGMEEQNIIKKIIPEVDCKKLGYDLVALINVTIAGGHLEMIEKKYAQHKNVCAVYDVTGNFDCLLITKFKNTSELNRFIKKLMAENFVERTNTSIVLSVVKESAMPFPLE